MNQYIILTICVLALVAWIYASEIMAKRIWRKCTRCTQWFSDCGDTTNDLPAHTPESQIAGVGVCHDCCADLEFSRE